MTRFASLAFLIALMASPAAGQASTVAIEFGHADAEGGLFWDSVPTENAAIRVVDEAPGADFDGAWVVLMTRVRAESPTVEIPTWLQYGPTDELGVPATSVVSTGVNAMLSAASQARIANRNIMAEPALASLYLDTGFLIQNSVASFGVAGGPTDGNQLPWQAMAPYWGGGFGFQLWAKTYQTTAEGVDVFNIQRVAESAMERQAPYAALVRAFLQSPDYATLIEEGGLQLQLQALVIRRMNPYDPPLQLPWYAFLPQGPIFGDDDCYLEISAPLELDLPIGMPEFAPGGNLLTSAPGVLCDGSNAGDAIYFFTGNALEVDTAVYPLLAGGTVSAPVYLIDQAFPEIGIYGGLLPVATSLLDPNADIVVTRTLTSIPASVVKFKAMPSLQLELGW